MTQNVSTSVPIATTEDKRMITTTFALTLSGTFLPMQLIYGEKLNTSLTKFRFPKTFSVSVHKK